MDTVTTPPTGKPIDLSRLADKFPADAIEWRIGRAGEKNGKVWATALPYITSRAIQARLDEVCGPENWKNEFKPGPLGGVMCGIAIRVNGEWIQKWDGADNTDVESVKGGFSDAMKRSAVHWGVGRYLYDLTETWATIDPKGEHVGVCKDESGKQVRFRWNPPKLPLSALPSGTPPQASEPRGLAAQPKQAQAPEAKPEPASSRQLCYIADLAKEKGLYDPQAPYAKFGLQGEPTKEQAKRIIDELKKLKLPPARKQAPAKAA
jgi:hypothetical protein